LAARPFHTVLEKENHMNRRTFILTSAAASALPFVAHAVDAPVRFEDGLVRSLLAEGKTVFVDFRTDWCLTCAAQERAIQAIRAKNPELDEHIVFVNVDWDIHANSKLPKSLNIPRRSTLVMLRGDEELGRIVAGTSTSKIRELIELGLPSA
jgi:thioredoxin 1